MSLSRDCGTKAAAFQLGRSVFDVGRLPPCPRRPQPSTINSVRSVAPTELYALNSQLFQPPFRLGTLYSLS